MTTRTPRTQNTQAACARIRLRSFCFRRKRRTGRFGAVTAQSTTVSYGAPACELEHAVLRCLIQNVLLAKTAASQQRSASPGYAAGKYLRAAVRLECPSEYSE